MEKNREHYVDFKFTRIKRLTVYADSKKEALEIARRTVKDVNIHTLNMPIISRSYSIWGVKKANSTK